MERSTPTGSGGASAAWTYSPPGTNPCASGVTACHVQLDSTYYAPVVTCRGELQLSEAALIPPAQEAMRAANDLAARQSWGEGGIGISNAVFRRVGSGIGSGTGQVKAGAGCLARGREPGTSGFQIARWAGGARWSVAEEGQTDRSGDTAGAGTAPPQARWL